MACCLQNQSYTTTLTNLTPYEAWFDHNPIYFSSLNIWMSHFCPCTWWKGTNLNFKLNKCIFVKYGKSHGIKCIGYLTLQQINCPSIGMSFSMKMPLFLVPRPTHQWWILQPLMCMYFMTLMPTFFVAPLVQGQIPIPNVLFPNSPPLTLISLTLLIKRPLKYIVGPPFPPHSHLWIFY